MIIGVGSQVLGLYFPLSLRLSDFDYICSYSGLQKFLSAEKNKPSFNRLSVRSKEKIVLFTSDKVIEIEIAWPGSNTERMINHKDFVEKEWAGNFKIASSIGLYSLKMSHRFKKDSVHFEKTRNDIRRMRENIPNIHQRYMRKMLEDEWREIFEERRRLTENSKTPKLNVTKKEFFNDNVNYIYDHDSLHLAVAHPKPPAYLQYKKENEEVMWDEKKWEDLPISVKKAGVYEEACVLALERHQIPVQFKVDPFISFKIALQKICTHITSGKFREFAWEYYDDVIVLYKNDPVNYVEKFKKAKRLNIVRKN